MAATWTISVNGGLYVRPSSLGFARPVITRRSFDVSTLSLAGVPSAPLDEPVLAYGDTVALRRDTTVVFRGTVTSVSQELAGRQVRWRYVVSDAWWQLQRIIYRQPAVVMNSGFTALQATMSTRVVLGQDVWGRSISIDAQIQAISSYALSQASGAWVLSSLTSLPTPPLSEARDITCAEAIRRCAALVPDHVAWFDYSSSPAVMRITRRGSLASVSLDLAANPGLTGFESLRSRPDLRPTGVIFTFLTTEENEADGLSYTRETQQTAGATTGQGVVSATIQLSRGESVPAGLAAEYYAALNYIPWEGSLRIKEPDCSRLVQLGQRVNLANGRAAWATMAAVVLGTVEDIDAGETLFELGPPAMYGPADFVEIMSFWRNRPPPTDWPNKRHNGTEGVDDGAGSPGIDGFGGPAPGVGSPAPNPDAGRPPGGAGSGVAGAGATASGSVSIPICVSGIETNVTVLKA